MTGKKEGGFTLVEVIIAIAVFVIVVPAVAGMIVSVGYINGRSNSYGIVDGIAQQKIESLRSAGYASLTNGTTDFSTEIPDQLGTPHSGSYTISDQSTSVKKIALTIDYTAQGQDQSHTYTAYISQHGLGQH